MGHFGGASIHPQAGRIHSGKGGRAGRGDHGTGPPDNARHAPAQGRGTGTAAPQGGVCGQDAVSLLLRHYRTDLLLLDEPKVNNKTENHQNDGQRAKMITICLSKRVNNCIFAPALKDKIYI